MPFMTNPRADAIIFNRHPLDRAGDKRSDSEWIAARLADPQTLIAPFHKLNPLIVTDPASRKKEIGFVRTKLVEPYLGAGGAMIFLGVDKHGAYFALEIPENLNPEAQGPLAGLGAFMDMRGAAMEIDPRDAGMLAQGRSLIDWHRRHGFCANCGKPTRMMDAGYRRVCDACNAEHFPRTDPVVIMLAISGGRCLLGRQPRFPKGFYSALAGFIEPGETIEAGVVRELKEEAGIDSGNVRYFATQPWPFPSSLMIGCFADALSEEIAVDGQELDDARWFTKAEAADMLAGRAKGVFAPPPVAIAHHLLKAWVEEG